MRIRSLAAAISLAWLTACGASGTSTVPAPASGDALAQSRMLSNEAVTTYATTQTFTVTMLVDTTSATGTQTCQNNRLCFWISSDAPDHVHQWIIANAGQLVRVQNRSTYVRLGDSITATVADPTIAQLAVNGNHALVVNLLAVGTTTVHYADTTNGLMRDISVTSNPGAQPRG